MSRHQQLRASASGMVTASLLLAATAPSIQARSAVAIAQGKSAFQLNCAGCHGEGGKGSGLRAPELRRAPPDLTLIAARNGGIFPFKKVVAIIDGRTFVVDHGGMEMPVWGTAFRQIDPTVAHDRIQDLAHFLASIQTD